MQIIVKQPVPELSARFIIIELVLDKTIPNLIKQSNKLPICGIGHLFVEVYHESRIPTQTFS